MKRMIGILLALLLCVAGTAGTAAKGDESRSLGIRLTTEEETVPETNIQMIFRGADLLVYTSLVPDHVLRFEAPDMGPSLLADCLSCHQLLRSGQFIHIFTGWLRDLDAAEEKGLFVGDSFDRAASRLSAEAGSEAIARLTERMERVQPAGDGSELAVMKRLVQLAARLLAENEGASFRVDCYDGGSALGIQMIRGGETLFTLSLNLEETNRVFGVFAFAEEGTIYDLGFQTLIEDGRDFSWWVTLCTDPNRAGYRDAFENHLILSVDGVVNDINAAEGERKENNVSGSLMTGRYGTVLHWTGSVSDLSGLPSGTLALRYGNDLKYGSLTFGKTPAIQPTGNEKRIDLSADNDPLLLYGLTLQVTEMITPLLQALIPEQG